jgi:hypothetical protein
MSLKQDPFYQAALKSASRSLDKRLQRKARLPVLVRLSKRIQAAGNQGVFLTFSSEGNNKSNVVS